MKYGIPFLLLSALFAYQGLKLGAAGFPLLCCAFSFGSVAIGYLVGSAKGFGKKDDGRLSYWSLLLHLPYLLFVWMTWHGLRLFSKEDPFNEVSDQLVIGRRLLKQELQQEFDHYVDLTAEFQETAHIRNRESYLCFPLLDGGVPDADSLLKFLSKLSEGRTYIHCAQGHGRTGLVALAYMKQVGMIEGYEEGIAILKEVRPALGLNATQTRFITQFLEQDLAAELS